MFHVVFTVFFHSPFFVIISHDFHSFFIPFRSMLVARIRCNLTVCCYDGKYTEIYPIADILLAYHLFLV